MRKIWNRFLDWLLMGGVTFRKQDPYGQADIKPERPIFDDPPGSGQPERRDGPYMGKN